MGRLKNLAIALLAAIAFSGGTVHGGKTAFLPSQLFPVAQALLPECRTEDSDWCLWDETPSGNPGNGNGQGESFVSLTGEYGILFG